MSAPNNASDRNAQAPKSRRWQRIIAVVASVLLLATVVIVPVTQGADDDLILYPLASSNFGRVLRVSGVAEPGQVVRIEANKVVVARTVANESGDFAVVFTPKRGMNEVQAVEDDALYPSRSTAYRVRHDPPLSFDKASRQQALAKDQAAAKTQIVAFLAVPAPVITTPAATTTNNPITLSGTAPAGTTVSFYVNGRYTRQVVATAGGTFSTWMPLEDNLNSIYATATNGPDTSPASNTVQTTYTNSIARTYAAGTISTPTVWTAGSTPTYTVNGSLTIDANGALWIQPGVTVNVSGNFKLLASGGEIAIRGTSVSRVLLRPSTALCTDTSPRRSDWMGVETTGATGRVSTEYADIYCASIGINFNGGTGSLKYSRMLNSGYGVRTFAASAASMIAPLISGGNEFRGNTAGVRIEANSSPIVSGGNLITANTYGIYVLGSGTGTENPLPVVNGNSIYGNTTNNYYVRSFGSPETILLNAKSNWWGTADPSAIAISISDRKDIATAPYVDFTGFLGSEGGSPVTSDPTLIGPISTNATLPAGNYLMLGDVVVNSGVTWTLSPGAIIRSVAGAKVLVSGALAASGTSSQRVHFTSAKAYQDKGDWAGIEVALGGTANLNYARVEYATSGVYFNAGQGAVTHSLIRFCTYGVYVGAKSNPTINLGNEIFNNQYGVYVRGNSTAVDNPQPVVNGNSLFSNTSYNYYTSLFVAPKPTLNATGNWWGTAVPASIAATIYTAGASSTAVDSSGYLVAEPFPPAITLTGLSMSVQQVKPLITTTQATGVFTISRSGSVSYRVVRDADGATVRQWTQTYAAPGQYGFNWDGFNDLGVAVAGGLYRVILTASDGLDPFVYDVPSPGTTFAPTGSMSFSYNPYLNELYKVNVGYAQSSLASLTVTPQSGTPFFAFKDVQYASGNQWIYWDGRGPDGALLTAPAATLANDATVMRANGVYVFTPAVGIVGTGAVPNIEVKSDPYLIAHSLDQVSSIVYRIDADATVRVTMLPPGVYDPASPAAIVVLNSESQSAKDGGGNPIDHTVVWRGFNDTDPNSVLVATDGVYTFAIEATLPATGQKTVYRGVLNIVQ